MLLELWDNNFYSIIPRELIEKSDEWEEVKMEIEVGYLPLNVPNKIQKFTFNKACDVDKPVIVIANPTDEVLNFINNLKNK